MAVLDKTSLSSLYRRRAKHYDVTANLQNACETIFSVCTFLDFSYEAVWRFQGFVSASSLGDRSEIPDKILDERILHGFCLYSLRREGIKVIGKKMVNIPGTAMEIESVCIKIYEEIHNYFKIKE